MIVPDIYLNAGGVTVSYFEWLKNLSHVRFGRLDKRFNQNSFLNILSEVERLTGRSIDADQKMALSHGGDEIDLVRSGLEETMISSYHSIKDAYLKMKDVDDLRTAAFVVAINKVANDYMTMGVFP